MFEFAEEKKIISNFIPLARFLLSQDDAVSISPYTHTSTAKPLLHRRFEEETRERL